MHRGVVQWGLEQPFQQWLGMGPDLPKVFFSFPSHKGRTGYGPCMFGMATLNDGLAEASHRKPFFGLILPLAVHYRLPSVDTPREHTHTTLSLHDLPPQP